MAFITAKNLVLGYEGQVVSRNINFEVNAGDYLCIIGENGSGKSTLMKTILNLRKPMGGTLEYGDGLQGNEIGYLPQQTAAQKDFPASVKEVVMSGFCGRMKHRFFFRSAEQEEALSHMKRLGIDHLADACYRNLSGGQQQRVLLARALCAAEKLLLLDEPVSGLDPQATREMYELIASLNHEDGMTIIMISHDISQALGEATHILHLAKEPLFFGTKSGYLRSSVGQAYATIMIAQTDGGEEE